MKGEAVKVLVAEGAETFFLSSEEETALLAAMAEGDRDDVVSADDFFRHLVRRG